jgi:hypothetical protein
MLKVKFKINIYSQILNGVCTKYDRISKFVLIAQGSNFPRKENNSNFAKVGLHKIYRAPFVYSINNNTVIIIIIIIIIIIKFFIYLRAELNSRGPITESRNNNNNNNNNNNMILNSRQMRPMQQTWHHNSRQERNVFAGSHFCSI